MRMDSDLYEYLLASSQGKLESLPKISWKKETAVCVVLASNGYPDSYPKNEKISGLENIDDANTMVFHAGTKQEGDAVLTNGGRVLGVTALGTTLESAISNAYESVGKIKWKNKYCRMDIGKKGLAFL